MPEQEKPKRAPYFFDVAASTPARPCKYCSALVYWITNPSGKRSPIHCDVEGGTPPSGHDGGRGISHFSDCPGADRARKGR